MIRLASLALLLSSLPLFATTVYDAAILALNPSGYWTLSDTTGTTATDLSGNGRNGTYTGGFTLNASGPFAGAGATTFNGSTGYVQLPGIWGGTADSTIIAWYKVNALTGNLQAVVSPSNLSYAHFQAFNAGNDVWFYTGGSTAVMPILPLDIGTWHMAVLTTSTGIQRQYIDGVLVGSNTVAYSTTQATLNNDLFIGRGVGSSRYFNGSLANVAIFSTALTSTDVNNLFAAATAAPEPSTVLLSLAGLSLALYRKRQSR